MLAVKAPHQIKATIRYVVKGERAIFYAAERDKSYWPGDDHEVVVTDLRSLDHAPSIERNGFTMLQQLTEVWDFPDSRQLEQVAGKGFMATNWMEQNKALFRALRLERLVTFITIGLIVFVAALNILISLTMMVMEKTRDIAVLISMGTRKSQVRRIFIAQGVLIGVVGTAIGLVLGYALSWAGGH